MMKTPEVRSFWDIKGEDVDDFELTSSSPDPFTGLRGPGEPIALKFKNDPDYENPTDENRDSVYKVTIVARDRFTGGLTDERPLTIFVDNVDEDVRPLCRRTSHLSTSQ